MRYGTLWQELKEKRPDVRIEKRISRFPQQDPAKLGECMSEYQMSIEQIISEVKKICEQAGVEHLYLFGSYAVGDAAEISDIDFYVKGAPDMRSIRERTDRIPTLKTIDFFDYDACKNPNLREDMELYGKEIY